MKPNAFYFLMSFMISSFVIACASMKSQPSQPVQPTAKVWSISPDSQLSFVAGTKSCTNLMDTLPAGVVKQIDGKTGKFSVASGTLPKGIKLHDDGRLCLESARPNVNAKDIVFQYEEPASKENNKPATIKTKVVR